MNMRCERGRLCAPRGTRGRRARARQWKSAGIQTDHVSLFLLAGFPPGNHHPLQLSVKLLFVPLFLSFFTLVSLLISSFPHSVRSHFLPVWLIPLQKVFICSLRFPPPRSVASVFHHPAFYSLFIILFFSLLLFFLKIRIFIYVQVSKSWVGRNVDKDPNLRNSQQKCGEGKWMTPKVLFMLALWACMEAFMPNALSIAVLSETPGARRNKTFCE